MSKILGEPFDTYVDTQVKIRQKSLGKSVKTSDDLKVFNTSTPWIRLTSAVEIDADRTEKLKETLNIPESQIVGSALAKNLVLFAGTSDGEALKDRKGGITQGGLDGAYGFLTEPGQGYKPMPGISSINVNYKNNGSLKQAQVSLKCFSRRQFEALETIYLRLGYTVVLEWGHSVYFDNSDPPKRKNMSSLGIPNMVFANIKKQDPDKEGKKAVEEARKKNPNLTEVEGFEIFFETKFQVEKENQAKDLSPAKIQKEIFENKKNTGGNYDGFLGKVSNFSWKLNNDLSYDITLDLVSVGDIIDSLKMNLGGGADLSRQVSVVVAPGVQNIVNIKLKKDTTELDKFFVELTERVLTKEARAGLNQKVQESLEEADSSEKYDNALATGREKYLERIKNLKDRWITPYYDIQNFIVGKEYSSTRSENIAGVFFYNFKNNNDFDSFAEKIEALYPVAKETNERASKDTPAGVGQYFGGGIPRTFPNIRGQQNINKVLEFFSIGIDRNTGKFIKEEPSQNNPQDLINNLNDKLTKLEDFFKNYTIYLQKEKPDGTPNESYNESLSFYLFLDESPGQPAQARYNDAIQRVLSNGYWDGSERFEAEQFKLNLPNRAMFSTKF